MKTSLLRLLNATVFAVSLGASSLASATTFSTNYSDLWWNQNEPGWGLNISQQANVLFATFFVYGVGDVAVWYSATLEYQSTGANGALTFGGDLFQTSGPFYGSTYNPALLRYRQVGTATVTFGDDAHALLQYTADGVVVTKSIERQTLRANSLAGSYIGSTTDITFNCTPPSRNNLLTTDPGAITITETPTDVGKGVTIIAPTCTYSGIYVQHGQMGRLSGTYNCTNGATGFFTFSELQVELGGLVGRYTGRDVSCEFRGNIGAMRRLQ